MPIQWREKIFPKKKSNDSNYPVSLFHIITGKSRKKRVNPTNNENVGPGTPENASCDSNNTPIKTNTTPDDPHPDINNDVNNNPIGISTHSNKVESSVSKSATSDSSLDICKEIEIMTYITHLDESNYNQSDFPGTFILPHHAKAELLERRKSNPIVAFLDPLSSGNSVKPKELLETNDSSEDSIKTYWGSASEKTSSEGSVSLAVPKCQHIAINTICENNAKVKPEQSKSNGDKREKALRQAVWENIEVILENFGLTFLDLVSNKLMLVTVNSFSRKSKTVPQSGLLDMMDMDPMEECTSLPKIVVMIDDPPQPTESPNSTMARLISVELYLLGLKLFIIPCYNFAPHIFNFMMKRLHEDNKQHRNFKSAYNFILKTGFTQLLQRPDTDVIIFDGDWLKGDVCQLITLAESCGHELIFMKNHQGIRKQAFVQVVVAKIRTRLNEFDELRLVPSAVTNGSVEDAPVSGESASAKTECCLDEANILHSDSGCEIQGPESSNLNSGHSLANPGLLNRSCSTPIQLTENSVHDDCETKDLSISSTFTRRTKSLFF